MGLVCRVLGVVGPSCGIVADVLTNASESDLVTDDVLAMTASPDVVDIGVVRIHFVTPILNPRTTDPMVLDGDRNAGGTGVTANDVDGAVKWGW